MNYKIWIFTLLAASFGMILGMSDEIKTILMKPFVENIWNKRKEFNAILRGERDLNGSVLDSFLKQYAPPERMLESIKKIENKFRKNPSAFVSRHDIPITSFLYSSLEGMTHYDFGIYFKGIDIERFIFSELIRDYIKKNKLQHCDVVKKYLYPNFSYKEKLSFRETKNCVIFEEPIKPYTGNDDIKLNLEIVKELTSIAEDVGYADWGRWEEKAKRTKNLIYTNDKKLVIIDTDLYAFLYQLESWYLFDGSVKSYYPIFSLNDDQKKYPQWFFKTVLYKKLLCKRLFNDLECGFDEEAKEWLEKRIIYWENEYQKEQESKEIIREDQFELSAYGPGFIGLL